ncbi:MAG: hypothetical protein U0176_20305 [Bacteroidia bacterium]
MSTISSINGSSARLSCEFERTISANGHLSVVLDGEYSGRYYEFVRHFEWRDSDPPIQSRTLNGWTRQHDYCLLAGMRWSGHFGGATKPLKYFVEPRYGIVLRHALLFHENVGLPPVPLNEVGVSPRFRAGMGWNIGKRLGLEGSADVRPYKYVGNGKRIWGVTPELDLCYRF